MKRAAVFVMLLLNVTLEVSGAADQSGPVVKNPAAKEVKRAKQTDSIPASGSSSSAFVGNLLVVPMDGSHWVGIKAIAQEMGRRGHKVTVVMPEFSMRMGPGKHYDTVTYPVPYGQADIDNLMAANKNNLKKSKETFVEKIRKKLSHLQKIMDFIHTTAETLLFNSSLISHLENQVNTGEQHQSHTQKPLRSLKLTLCD